MIQENFIKLFETSICENWDLPAMTDFSSKESYTYGQTAAQIARLHLIFAQAGIEKGDKVALIGRNSSKWCIAYIAVIGYGAVVVPILPDFNPKDIENILNHSDARLIFTLESLWKPINATQLTQLEAALSLTDYSCIYEQSGTRLTDFINNTPTPKNVTADTFRLADYPNTELILLNYTSGTTGLSKGVMLTGGNLASNALFGRNSNLHFKGSRCVAFLPLAHAYGAAFDFLTPIISGGHIYLIAGIPTPPVLLKAFAEVRPNLICTVPLILEKIYRKQIQPKISSPAMRILLNIPGINKLIYKKINRTLTDTFGGQFEEVIIGGAALNAEVEQFLKKIGFRFSVGYGMTECAPLISYSHWTQFRPTSCGEILRGLMEARIVREQPTDTTGEIQVRGKHVMLGYYKNEEATAQVFTPDGWLKTGDMGTQDADGHIFIRGRNKNMLLSGNGQNIYPEEIEAKLNNLEFVVESLVIECNKRLFGLIVLNTDEMKAKGVTDIERLLEAHRRELNNVVASYETLQKLYQHPTEFEKTPKKSIKRFLYNDIELK